jgi:hypothetical protein
MNSPCSAAAIPFDCGEEPGFVVQIADKNILPQSRRIWFRPGRRFDLHSSEDRRGDGRQSLSGRRIPQPRAGRPIRYCRN